ncbi:hypothetical protein CKALI_05305 [Corynebacterium kalinowskii]|uniref:Uncharacterized protein n=1 Tax=Corynebacterium kalinowskii TaxID=2675216 RepID=A0A6B8V9Y9_9CORY|nr:hypothetical protein CKALI_05305 [Corynebacterium kalinowskii]
MKKLIFTYDLVFSNYQLTRLQATYAVTSCLCIVTNCVMADCLSADTESSGPRFWKHFRCPSPVSIQGIWVKSKRFRMRFRRFGSKEEVLRSAFSHFFLQRVNGNSVNWETTRVEGEEYLTRFILSDGDFSHKLCVYGIAARYQKYSRRQCKSESFEFF